MRKPTIKKKLIQPIIRVASIVDDP